MPQLLLSTDRKSGWLRAVYCAPGRRLRRRPGVKYAVAKQHQMFSDVTTALIRYPLYTKLKKCAVCGTAKKRGLWTMLLPFRAWDVENLQTHMSIDTTRGPVFDALTPVCKDHPMNFADLTHMSELARALEYYAWMKQQPPPPAPRTKPAP